MQQTKLRFRPGAWHDPAVRSSIPHARPGSRTAGAQPVSRHLSRKGVSLPAQLASLAERLRPVLRGQMRPHPTRPVGVIAAADGESPAMPRHRRVPEPSADFDQRRRWLIAAAAGLFGLSVLMLGLLQVDAGRLDAARPDTAVVVAPSSPSSPPETVAPPALDPPAPAQRAVPAGSGRSAPPPMRQGIRYAEQIAGPWVRYIPRISG